MSVSAVVIGVFADNLRELLLAPPLGSRNVLAIDPGFRTGCKIVCLDRQGKLLHNDVIYPTASSDGEVREAAMALLSARPRRPPLPRGLSCLNIMPHRARAPRPDGGRQPPSSRRRNRQGWSVASSLFCRPPDRETGSHFSGPAHPIGLIRSDWYLVLESS